MIEGIARGRVAAAAGDQNVDILPRRPIGPERVPIAREIAAIPLAADVRGVEVGNRKGIHPLLVLPGDRAVLGCRFLQRPSPSMACSADCGGADAGRSPARSLIVLIIGPLFS